MSKMLTNLDIYVKRINIHKNTQLYPQNGLKVDKLGIFGYLVIDGAGRASKYRQRA